MLSLRLTSISIVEQHDWVWLVGHFGGLRRMAGGGRRHNTTTTNHSRRSVDAYD